MDTHARVGGGQSLEGDLAEIERASAHEGVRGPTPLLDRLYARRWVHRLLPDWLALSLVSLRARILWRLSSSRRERARARVALMFEGTGREHELDQIARKQMVEEALRQELKMRPWICRRYRVEGLANLEKARAGGRGVLVMGLHFGAPRGTSGPLSAYVERPYMSGAEWLYADMYEGREALVALEQRRIFEELGGRWVPRGGSYGIFKVLLERGELCIFHFDVPGSAETEFLGKRAWVGSGLARLARETGVLIVPSISEGGCRRPRLHLHTPIDPAQFDTEQQLVEHLAARASGFILDSRPEAWEPNDFPPQIFREQAERYGWAFR